MQERTRLDQAITGYYSLEHELEDALALAELAEEENDEESFAEAVENLRELQSRSTKLELESLLSGEGEYIWCPAPKPIRIWQRFAP